MLQNGWTLESGFLQNDPGFWWYLGLEASLFIVEISTGLSGGNLGPCPLPQRLKQPMVTLVLSTSMSRLSGNRSFAVTNRTSRRVSVVSACCGVCDYVTNHFLTCGAMSGNMWKHEDACGNKIWKLATWIVSLISSACSWGTPKIERWETLRNYARWGLPIIPKCSPLRIPNMSKLPVPLGASINSKKREEALVDGVAHEDICDSRWSTWSQNGKEHGSLTRTAAAVNLIPMLSDISCWHMYN